VSLLAIVLKCATWAAPRITWHVRLVLPLLLVEIAVGLGAWRSAGHGRPRP